MRKNDSVFVHCPVCGERVNRVQRGKAGYMDCTCCGCRLAYIIQLNGNVILEVHKQPMRAAV